MNEFEEQIQKIKIAFDKLAQAKGKSKENEIRHIYHFEPEACEAIKLLLDPSIVFHIGKKSFSSLIPYKEIKEPLFNNLFPLCLWLQSKKALTNADIARVQWSVMNIKNPDLRQFSKEFICKTITLGVTAKTINKALGFEFIPEFSCMLANKYFEHQDQVEGKHFYLTEKLDGFRCLSIVTEEGANLFTRQGQPIEGLDDVERDLIALRWEIGKNYVFDGELIIANRENFPSKEQYKRTTNIVQKDGKKEGVVYHVFDVLDADAFQSKNCDTPYYLRRQKLHTYFQMLESLSNFNNVRPVPILYHGTDTAEIMKQLNVQRGLEHEGVMVNLADETYKFTRTNALLKVKVMQDCDLEIIDVQPGTGKFTGNLGAIIVDYKGNPVGVGSGLTDEMRRKIWENSREYIGRIATIQYFESTTDKTGKESLRFPVFKELREEGKEVSYS